MVRKEYLEKLDRIQKYGKFIKVKGSLMDRYKDV